MDVVIKILQFIVSFSLLVFVHELGHFLTAKIFGMRVDKFYLFFNPWFSLVKFKIGETEFGIGWVPFGGYCKIAGMIDESMDTETLSKPPQPYEFRTKPAWQRLIVMLGGVIMNVILAICIYVGMSYHYGESYIANKDLTYGWQFNELGHEMGFRDGDKILSIDGKEYEKTDQILKKVALSNGATVEVVRNGRPVTIDISEEYTKKKLGGGFSMTERLPFIVDSVQAGSPAAAAGLAPGDSIFSVNGVQGTYAELRRALLAAAGSTTDVSFARDSAGHEVVHTVPVTVSAEGRVGIVTIMPLTIKKYNLWQAIPAGIKMTGREISDYIDQIKLIFSPKTEAYKNLGGPIMIGSIFPDKWIWQSFWSITAFISIVLAIMNILPIPGLDGGHVLFTLFEMVTGRKPGDKFLEFAQIFGMMLILLLMVYVMGNDIYRFFIK